MSLYSFLSCPRRPRRLLAGVCGILGVWLLTRPVRVCAQDQPTPPAQYLATPLQQDGTSQPESTSAQQLQDSAPAPPSAADESTEPTTIFSHSDTTRWYLGGQVNVIYQFQPAFPAEYSGPNSFGPGAEGATTEILTFYSGYEVTHTTEVLADVEEALGGGVGGSVGLAGYVDLDAVRTVEGSVLPPVPYFARLMVHQIIPLSHDRMPAQRTPLGLFTSLPVRRIEIRFGKFTLPDFLDTNRGGTDSHLQFMNWTVDANGVWDYAANTRGYTDALYLEYDDHWFTARFAEALMPKLANGIYLDADLARAHAENLEFDAGGNFIAGRLGNFRLLVYENHANMGNYQEAINDYLHGMTSAPDVVATREQGRTKYGVGFNFDQDITSDIGIFGRSGWADGKNESFAYTEVDQTVEAGAWIRGVRWRRDLDKIGVAFVSNAISGAHREYLALGGLGFLLGDGALNYGREDLVEGYYTAHIWRGVWGAFDFQQINNPGYNRDRGPASVLGVRLHVDF